MITTYTSRDAEACAYLSALVTVELCAEVHRKGKVNTAIRRCVNRLLPGLVEHKRVYLIFKGLAKQPSLRGACTICGVCWRRWQVGKWCWRGER